MREAARGTALLLLGLAVLALPVSERGASSMTGPVAGTAVPGREAAGSRTLAVAVSVPPHAWLVERIGGARVRVVELLRPGESPHTFQPSDAEVTGLARAKIFFRAGVALERGPWLKAVVRRSGLLVVDLLQGVALRPAEGHGHREGASGRDGPPEGSPDPHTWLSPELLRLQGRRVAATLSRRDPGGEALYRRRLSNLEGELGRLDRGLRRRLAPVRGRSFLVFHPAWGYFADAYGLRQVAVEHEGKAPSDAELTGLMRRLGEVRARVFLIQPQVSGLSAHTLASMTGIRLKVVDPLAREVPASLRRMASLLLLDAGK